jgi:hypothetical protein
MISNNLPEAFNNQYPRVCYTSICYFNRTWNNEQIRYLDNSRHKYQANGTNNIKKLQWRN